MQLPQIRSVAHVELHTVWLGVEPTGCNGFCIVEIDDRGEHLAMRAEVELDAAPNHPCRPKRWMTPRTDAVPFTLELASCSDIGRWRSVELRKSDDEVGRKSSEAAKHESSFSLR